MQEVTTAGAVGPYMKFVLPVVRRTPARLGGGPNKTDEAKKKLRSLMKRIGLPLHEMAAPTKGLSWDLGREKIPKDLDKDGSVADDNRSTDKKPDYEKDDEEGKNDKPLKKPDPAGDEPEEEDPVKESITRFRSISTTPVAARAKALEQAAFDMTLEQFDAQEGSIYEWCASLNEDVGRVPDEEIGARFLDHVMDEMSRRNLRRAARNIDKGRTGADAGTKSAASKFRRREAQNYAAKKKVGRFARAVGRGIKKAAGALARGTAATARGGAKAAKALGRGAAAAGRGAKAAASSDAGRAVGRGIAKTTSGIAGGIGSAAKAVGREVMTRARERGQYNQAKRMKKLQTADIHEALAAFRENQVRLNEARRSPAPGAWGGSFHSPKQSKGYSGREIETAMTRDHAKMVGAMLKRMLPQGYKVKKIGDVAVDVMTPQGEVGFDLEEEGGGLLHIGIHAENWRLDMPVTRTKVRADDKRAVEGALKRMVRMLEQAVSKREKEQAARQEKSRQSAHKWRRGKKKQRVGPSGR